MSRGVCQGSVQGVCVQGGDVSGEVCPGGCVQEGARGGVCPGGYTPPRPRGTPTVDRSNDTTVVGAKN